MNKVFKNKGKEPENSVDEQGRSKQIEKKFEWVGIRFDSEKFEKICKERWEYVDGAKDFMRCKVHNTVFKPDGDPGYDIDVEPCWGCYNECKIIL